MRGWRIRTVKFPALQALAIFMLMSSCASPVAETVALPPVETKVESGPVSSLFTVGQVVTVGLYCESERSISRLINYVMAGDAAGYAAFFGDPNTDCYRYVNARGQIIRLVGVILRIVNSKIEPNSGAEVTSAEVEMYSDSSVIYTFGD